MVARFAAGRFARIEAVLAETEDRTDFVRAAVERELARREDGSWARPKAKVSGALECGSQGAPPSC